MIPITFNKDDISNEKKGTIRGQDLASFLSISMPKNAGILDIWDNPVSVTNISYTTGYAVLTLSKGYINIFGRCIYVEQGEQVSIPLASSGTVNGVFGIKIDLAQTGNNEVYWFYKTSNLQQDNILNNEISGVYEFGIYEYSVTTSSITLGSKIANTIENISSYLENDFKNSFIFDTSYNITTNAFTGVNKGGTKLPNNLILLWGYDKGTSNNYKYYFDDTYPITKVLHFQYNIDGSPRPYSSGFSAIKQGDTIIGFETDNTINTVNYIVIGVE